jgi:hypothetical protein
MEPPTAGATHLPLTRRYVIEDKNGQDGITAFDSGGQSGIVSDTKIVAKPYEDRVVLCVHGITDLRAQHLPGLTSPDSSILDLRSFRN